MSDLIIKISPLSMLVLLDAFSSIHTSCIASISDLLVTNKTKNNKNSFHKVEKIGHLNRLFCTFNLAGKIVCLMM